MSLPQINILINNTIYVTPEDGSLIYQYKPLQNLKIEKSDGKIDLDRLTMLATEANIDINNPIDLQAELTYDESVNIIINDHKNPLKIVNSRFYLTSDSTYRIADREGNLDTNIYTKANFPIEAGLIKTVRTIVGTDFLGIFDGGSMPVGSYHFYFKLADVDGNESDFIAESGKVVCHIGVVNNPQSIRGGLIDENSDKLIKFKLKNLDLAYNYINVYYTRSTGDDKMEMLKTYKVNDKYRIIGTETEISITGYEDHEEIDVSEINVQYSIFDSVQTETNCQNMTFAGNIVKDYSVYKTLEKYSLLVVPKLLHYDDPDRKDIGYLNEKYEESYSVTEGYEYYNTKNVYYKLGYWDEEIYRFGIVYIMNDYTLSPVFNVRGISELSEETLFHQYGNITTSAVESNIEYGDDFIMNENANINNLENAKGIFRIKSISKTHDGKNPIKPIGLKFSFQSDVLAGANTAPGLKDITKGYFIVRQKRIPTLLAQGVGIATSKKAYIPLIYGTFKDPITPTTITNEYFGESFLKSVSSKPLLARGLFKMTNDSNHIVNNALLCPEANMRPYLFNNYFNSSEFVLKRYNHYTGGIFNDIDTDKAGKMFYLGSLNFNNDFTSTWKSNLLLVEPGIDLIHNNDSKFSSKAGDESIAWEHLDPKNGDLANLREDTNITEADWSNGVTKVRGEFNGYVGSTYEGIEKGQYYNIFQKNYDPSKWRDYFKVRANDSSPFAAISDRISWETMAELNGTALDADNLKFLTLESPYMYRGDCYINTYTHRMLWNFIDPELPTNKQIIDPYNWFKHFRVKKTDVIIQENSSGTGATLTYDTVIMDNTNKLLTDSTATKYTYKKVLDAFTYKSTIINVDIKTTDSPDPTTYKITLPDSKDYKKYSEANGIFGASKLNRPDINAVPLGHWVTFKICSNINLALRDLDFSRPAEEAVHKMKRGFFPLQSAKPENKLPESNVINSGINATLSNKYYFEVPDVPFIKTSFTTRINYSDILQETAFKNGNRVFRSQNYQDYSNEYGALVKLIEWYGTLIAIMEHGVLMIPVNERAAMANVSGENVYINTENVLPKNPKVLSNLFGSRWSDAIVSTQRFIYGLDTVAKKIWRTDGNKFEVISDLKVQKFLNDNIKLSIADRSKITGTSVIKTHYNAFKYDIMFTYIYKDINWHLVWNELQNKWVTQCTWFPEFSENINNIFYTFANEKNHPSKGNFLYKHGFAGDIEESGEITSCKWYDEQQPFEYEFVVTGVPGVQKIFNNLKIISNWAEPNSFEFEVVGEGFDWSNQKGLIYELRSPDGLDTAQAKNQLVINYRDYLIANPAITKIPFIWARDPNIFNEQWPDPAAGNRDITIRNHNKTSEKLVTLYQNALDLEVEGRLKGNMQYVEDSWDIQIQPIRFKYGYLSGENLAYSENVEMRVRDKYLKVRVKYNGEKYAIINAVRTLFTISYA